MKFENIVPILYSSDVVKSIAYYTEVLGFENHWDWGKANGAKNRIPS
jgi:catechol 2,3-dioxygenase-like lactoylglutathione lyase family enzyme